MSPSNRRNPDELLEALKKTNEGARGKLRIFLGMCPGVGKTFSMLEAAKQQATRGVRVLVGVVETHGRKETEALLHGLNVLPKRDIQYKDTTLTEMDLDGILEKRPPLVLVDELAHTNAPGSRHAKRYQDVEELLSAGIDVFTTVNVQHIESRNDQVAQITGILVRETVPDSFLELATQIEVVDLPPSELLERLSEGKVYLGDRAARAAEGFFKEEHLLALRELSLRFVAEKVDQDLHNHMTIKGIEGPWNTNERLLVAVSCSPYSARLIRTTRRMAYNLEAPWVALYVDTGETLKPEDLENLQKNISLARELGAEVITIADNDVAYAIQKVSQDRNVTQIIMGRPDRRFIHDLFARGSLLDKLVRDTSKVDVHVIRAERKPRYRGFAVRWPNLKIGFFPYYNTAWFLVAVSFLCRGLLPIIGYQALGSIFLLSILVVASFTTAGPILVSAVFCATVWNFFFIPPTWSFTITSAEDTMMVISFFVAALVGGLLTSRIRRQESVLEARESETRLLYELVKRFSDAKGADDVATILAETIRKQFHAGAAVLLADSGGLLSKKTFGRNMTEKERAVAEWSFTNGKLAGWSTQTLSASTCLCLPMKGNTGVVGVVAFYPPSGQKDLAIDTENFIETVIAQTAIVLERLEFRGAADATKLYEASERLHQTLLNSVSHELRTPITTLIGATSALKDEKTIADPSARNALTDEVIGAARRLDRVVENLLDVSRLEKGTLQLKKEWFEVGDLLGLVSAELRDELHGKKINLKGDSSILIEGDFQLLDHALSQIILNAAKYGTPGTEIEVTFETHEKRILISIRDEGPGIPVGLEKQLFDKFYRLPGTPAGGIGLGLSIVKSIVELHGGGISASNRADLLGAQFMIDLPLMPAPEILREALL
jgi:two-component system sensor histidine kinase KdpD